ncbi:hypothetical protein AOL_s00088g34 [Orbilia oligospora ATCC 24927]|uniref:Uncharacterized protein n=2 Tax=Orbilia oligospora TaxID=2813651 RepID=G1XHS1_ARTOA|nr:hypothetical protein AOL_s00088g34 [Orbilia oligospora ATCC 24927]EGX47319.1 hypothetical protein AOL_s00088g34 [Orbilia oligospora ATCC 24927]KAF3270581.1 hypothetical protein TWF970_010784 [Orbilia oligospora]
MFPKRPRLGKPAKSPKGILVNSTSSIKDVKPVLKMPVEPQPSPRKRWLSAATNTKDLGGMKKVPASSYLTIHHEILLTTTSYLPPPPSPVNNPIIHRGVFAGTLPDTKLDEVYPGWIDRTKANAQKFGVSVAIYPLAEGFWVISLQSSTGTGRNVEHAMRDIDGFEDNLLLSKCRRSKRSPKVTWMTASQISSFKSDLELLCTGSAALSF